MRSGCRFGSQRSVLHVRRLDGDNRHAKGIGRKVTGNAGISVHFKMLGAFNVRMAGGAMCRDAFVLQIQMVGVLKEVPTL